MRLIKQSQTAQPLMFLMIDSTDHINPKTGLSPTVTLSKNGAAFASPAGAVTEVGSGWYKVAGNATDTDTLGPLILHAIGTGADVVDVEYGVVAFDPQLATNLGLSNLDALISSRMATYAQPTGFLAATFPGTVASPTNITAATGIVLSGVTHTGAVIPTVSVVTGLTASNLDAAISSRMATYTQPIGFLAATFPTGTVANTTNITAGTITTVTTVTGLTASNLDATVSSRLATASYVAPTNLTAAAIATGVWQDAVAGDFTTASSIGKALYVGNIVPGAAGGLFIAGTNATTTVNITGNLSGSVGSVSGNVGGNVVGSVGSVTTAIVLPTIPTDWITATGIATDAFGALELAAGAASEIATAVRTELTTELLRIDVATSTRLAAASYTPPSNLTAAQIATGVWQDTTAGDFTTALSVGKSVMNGVALGTGLTIVSVSGSVGSVTGNVSGSVASVVGAVGSVTGLIASNLDATISSRMATYAQPTGFLAATFPADIASPTNITAATGIVLSGVTHTGAVIPTVSAVTGLTASNLDVAVSTRLATASYTTPPSAAAISSLVGSDLSTAHGAGSWTTATGFSTLVMADIRTAIGLATANLDSQIVVLRNTIIVRP